jgi:assimilatory nitrate reductase catalytic subunit
MGGREVGGLANLLSAHRDMSNPSHRAEVARLWGVDSVPEQAGTSAVEMFEAAADGRIKALWIACTNPAQSMPDLNQVHKALKTAEFVVVQEAFAGTASCAQADLLLPASTWGEKTGTVTNSERRISRVNPAVPPPGQARHDWAIAVDFAQRLEARLRPGKPTLFPYPLDEPETAVELIWNEHRDSTRGRDLDITGLSYAVLADSPQQWPMPAGSSQGRARLYEDGVFPTASGKAQFANVSYKPTAEQRDSKYPFSLTTGRLRDQWHGMSRTGTLGRLFGHVAEPAINLNALDMDRRGLKDGDLVTVTSKRGQIVVPVRSSDEVGYSQAFMAMHWGPEFLSGCASNGQPLLGINALTTSSYCPTSKQPELKHAAVRIERANMPWSLLAAVWVDDASLGLMLTQLRAMMSTFAFSTCVPFASKTALEEAAGQRQGILFRAASLIAPEALVLGQLETILGLTQSPVLRYEDANRAHRRVIRLQKTPCDTQLTGFLLAGDVSSQTWIKALLQEQLPAQTYGRLLLVPGATAPVQIQAGGQQVCSCFNVTDIAIDRHLQSLASDCPDRLANLQATLKCGTNCGSCVPEFKRRLAATHSH